MFVFSDRYFEKLEQFVAQLLHEVHVGQLRQNQVTNVFGEGNLGLLQPSPVEGVCNTNVSVTRNKKNVWAAYRRATRLGV